MGSNSAVATSVHGDCDARSRPRNAWFLRQIRGGDHVADVLSATLLGGFVHAAAYRRSRDPQRCVLAAIVGDILWEITEYIVQKSSDRLGIKPVLVYYGLRATLEDLLFSFLGTLLVLLFGDHLLRNFTGDAD